MSAIPTAAGAYSDIIAGPPRWAINGPVAHVNWQVFEFLLEFG